ncbi:NTF2 fold immunity protein [Pseudomonas chengduensis]|jgi:hypothetical protein
MSRSAFFFLPFIIGTVSANGTCPEIRPNQAESVTSALHAIKIARNAMLEIHEAEYLADFEPFAAEKINNIWHVYGSLSPDMLGGTPESKVCATTGEVLETYHSQ